MSVLLAKSNQYKFHLGPRNNAAVLFCRVYRRLLHDLEGSDIPFPNVWIL